MFHQMTKQALAERNSMKLSSGSAFSNIGKMEFPPVLDKELFVEKTYNCLIVKFDDGTYVANCGDAPCLHGEGCDKVSALRDLCNVMEESVTSGHGNVFSESSKIEEQRILLKRLLERYQQRGVVEEMDGVLTLFHE
jgi:hypothetical protein